MSNEKPEGDKSTNQLRPLQPPLARAVLFVEDLLFDRPVSVKLAGGKNELFQDGSDVTTVQGKLTVRQGTVDINGMRFK